MSYEVVAMGSYSVSSDNSLKHSKFSMQCDLVLPVLNKFCRAPSSVFFFVY